MVDRRTLFQTRSLLGVPVLLEKRVLGVLEAVNKKKGKFSRDDLRVLEQMAGFLAIPLHNAVLFRAITRETLAKERLIELGKKISASADISGVLTALKEIICAEIQPLAACVHVSSENRTYDLLSNSSREQAAIECLGTTIGHVDSRFPLRAEGAVLGYLDIQSEKMISDEAAALFRGLAAFMAISLEKFRFYPPDAGKGKNGKGAAGRPRHPAVVPAAAAAGFPRAGHRLFEHPQLEGGRRLLRDHPPERPGNRLQRQRRRPGTAFPPRC